MTEFNHRANQMLVAHSIKKQAQYRANEIAWVCNDKTISWCQLLNRVQCLASAFKGLGLKPGDRVAILAENSIRYIEMLFATQWAGGVVLPINTTWCDTQTVFALNDALPKVFYVDSNHQDRLEFLSKGIEEEIALICDEFNVLNTNHNYEPLISQHEPVAAVERAADDVAAIYYTDGVSGQPKGVQLTNNGLATSALTALASYDLPSKSVFGYSMPLCHIANVMFIYASAMQGLKQVILPVADTNKYLIAINDNAVTDVLFDQPVMASLVSELEGPGDPLLSLKNIFYVGDVSTSLLQRSLSALDNTVLIKIFGQTEISAALSFIMTRQYNQEFVHAGRYKSVGRANFAVEVNIIDTEGRVAPAGVVGELVASGGVIMSGYWNLPDKNKSVFKGGRFYTGYMGFIDEDGFIYICDRKENVIKTQGDMVYTLDIENTINQMDEVIECAVVGIPHSEWGEEIHALVIVDEECELSSQAVIEYCKERLESKNCPYSVAVHVDPLPKTSSGNIKKYLIREPFWEQQREGG